MNPDGGEAADTALTDTLPSGASALSHGFVWL
ncbi:hypothetical protein QMY54_01879 [Pseudomonas rhodesiae]|nr:hypothetical protein QMY54_01879 [Pseudomonas rhodesiae]